MRIYVFVHSALTYIYPVVATDSLIFVSTINWDLEDENMDPYVFTSSRPTFYPNSCIVASILNFKVDLHMHIRST